MVKFVVAVDEENAIGKDNQLMWDLPDDMKRFKELTIDTAVIMGRKTYDSIGRALPKRLNIVISRDENYPVAEGVVLVNSLEKAMEVAKESSQDISVIGGGEIYKLAMDYVDTLEVTVVHTQMKDAEAFFPDMDLSSWKLVYEEYHPEDEKHKFDFTYLTYKK